MTSSFHSERRTICPPEGSRSSGSALQDEAHLLVPARAPASNALYSSKGTLTRHQRNHSISAGHRCLECNITFLEERPPDKTSPNARSWRRRYTSVDTCTKRGEFAVTRGFAQDDLAFPLPELAIESEHADHVMHGNELRALPASMHETASPQAADSCIVSTEVLGAADNLKLETRVNGELRQSSNTGDLVFGVKALVSFLSQGQTIQAGSLIMTGTPGGVGLFQDPPNLLKDGDVVKVEIEGIGEFENRMAFE
ncbi:hypothetical protein CERZMDRAFT_88651 [Cercospora zeae-maydis SCOH1-5]|uniref:Fumarylacetoacetase-like C-terminal domain-containing protein n=1 Tax=Cercospora zeae-maydis SCOH1-5 TaxID=717836 RepID=A0A6A6F000_9PEZI|nr:hypothetical protein CERZMDRAFT_88651 [Cercospora zeae-maydis SCOH1-5]